MASSASKQVLSVKTRLNAQPTVVMRAKGQVTIPAELRDELGWRDGELLRVVKTERGLLLEEQPDIMSLAGIFHKYAPPEHWSMTGEEILRADEQALRDALDEDLFAELDQ